MNLTKRFLAAIDRWQRQNRAAGPLYGVIKKYGDDKAGLLVVALGWYGFTSIYPLLLVVVTVLGFVGQASLGHGFVTTLHQFPVIGDQFTPGQGGQNLHGSVLGLVIGAAGLLYGSQGVTQTAQQAMAAVWNVPEVRRPGFLPRLVRSLGGLTAIGAAFVVSAAVSSVVSGAGRNYAVRVPVIVALVIVNTGFYFCAFRILTPKVVDTRPLLPGSVVGGIGFTFLTTLGTALVQHQLKHVNATYGALGSVIGVVTYLALLAKLSVYAAELNPVLARDLWPRALPTTEPTDADDQVLHDLAHQQRRREDQRVGVGFGDDSVVEAGADASDDDVGAR
jgi:uncharacterized BrkB/YihY/UPF0761 family membrane protein